MIRESKKQIFIIALLVLIAALTGYSAPVWGEVFDISQPDGSIVSVKIWGDEHYQRVESLDGYILTKNAEGWIVYAEVSDDEAEYIPTENQYTISKKTRKLKRSKKLRHRGKALRKGKRISRKSRKEKIQKARQKRTANLAADPLAGVQPGTSIAATSSSRLTGNVLGLTIIVDFSDEEATIPRDEIVNYLNQQGYSNYGNNGSVNDFFWDVSNGQLNYTQHVTQYYRAQHPKSYYDDGTRAAGTVGREIVEEALIYMRDIEGLEFSQFDSNVDGYIDAINVFYAGTRAQPWNKGLWPHQWSMTRFTANGVRSSSYQITDIRSTLSLGVFCHENGHMLFGWPDTYDYDYDSRGAGKFDLMSTSGGTNPLYPNPHFRYTEGWITPIDINGTNTGAFSADANSSDAIFRYENPNDARESYILEVKEQSDRNSTLPGEGLLIWHIDENGSNSNNERLPQSHFKITVVQADGDWDLETDANSGEQSDFFYQGNNTNYSSGTNPAAIWWDGTPSVFNVSNVSSIGPTMTFNIGLEGPEENLITNGDFTDGESGWVLDNFEGASAQTTVSNESLTLEISNAGSASWNIQFKQPGIPLEDGKQYRMSFSARAESSRKLDVNLETDGSPWTNYSNTDAFTLTTVMSTYTHEFSMSGTDLNARMVFNAGTNISNVTIDNISVVEIIVAVIPELTSFEFDPITVAVGTTTPLVYRAYDQVGDIIELDGTPQFSTTGGGGFYYNNFVAEEAGEWTMTLSYEGVTASAIVTVVEDPLPVLTTIVFDPIVVMINQTATLVYRGYDQYGAPTSTMGLPDFSTTGGGWFNYTHFVADEVGIFTMTLELDGIVTTAQLTVFEESSSNNMILNGDFNSGTDNWDLNTAEGANASVTTANGACIVGISNGGGATWNVQFKQVSIPLEQGKHYSLSFQAHGATARSIEVRLETDGSPWSNYANTSPFSITTTSSVFTHDFVMNTTDMNARIVFNVGSNSSDVTIDNVTLVELEVEEPVLTTIEFDPITVTVGNSASLIYRGYDQFGSQITGLGLPTFTTTGGGWFNYTHVVSTDVGEWIMTLTLNNITTTASLSVLPEVTATNLISNGDFSYGTSNWDLYLADGGNAQFSTNGGQGVLAINNGGSASWNVQFKQGGLPLEQGKTYRFSFDARASDYRTIEAHLETDGSPWSNYGSIAATSITPTLSNYSYDFVMPQTDMNARVVFNIGVNSNDVYLDNVMVVEL
ncbi:MAG: carbohydrate binding domain-containing protein [Fibrobacterales bacterium]